MTSIISAASYDWKILLLLLLLLHSLMSPGDDQRVGSGAPGLARTVGCAIGLDRLQVRRELQCNAKGDPAHRSA